MWLTEGALEELRRLLLLLLGCAVQVTLLCAFNIHIYTDTKNSLLMFCVCVFVFTVASVRRSKHSFSKSSHSTSRPRQNSLSVYRRWVFHHNRFYHTRSHIFACLVSILFFSKMAVLTCLNLNNVPVMETYTSIVCFSKMPSKMYSSKWYSFSVNSLWKVVMWWYQHKFWPKKPNTMRALVQRFNILQKYMALGAVIILKQLASANIRQYHWLHIAYWL